MNAQRVKSLMGATIMGSAAAALASVSAPAAAQVSNDAVLGILRECAKIGDPTARLACYDNNIRLGNVAVPGSGGRVQGGGAPIGPEGFGGSSVKSPDRFRSGEERGEGPDEIRAKVVKVQLREPGIYLVEIEGGAQWVFSQSVSRSFRIPRVGALVEIQKASLGSFLMVVDGQSGVRVRRTK
jgi:hypothetical protein